METDLHERMASSLLSPLWRGVPSEYKMKYARNIWGQFEAQIKSAAYTDSLAKFLDKISQRLNIAILEADTEEITGWIKQADERASLAMLRQDTSFLVLLVRVANEERREQFKAKQAAKEAFDQAAERMEAQPGGLFEES